MNPKTDRDRQVFVLSVASNQLDEEVGRMLELGASRHAISEAGETVLEDPDGNTFVVHTTSQSGRV